MKDNYDFSQGKRGAVIPTPSHQVKINLTLDKEIIEWFQAKVNKSGGGDYHQLISDALKDYIRQEKNTLQSTSHS